MMSYYEQLIQFLAQAITGSLTTNHFIRNYREFKVKVSFGQGVPARIPWVSFLKDPHTTSRGIYPVYLYYKDINRLILAFGVSETNGPATKWNIENVQSIYDFFRENNLGEPRRYGSSYVYKSYDVNQLPEREILDQDLNAILNIYSNQPIIVTQNENHLLPFNIRIFADSLRKSGLNYSDLLVTRLAASLITKPFVILTGLSGSGKTKLAQSFVQWICNDELQYLILPVGADWTNREPLLGYPNALKLDEYVRPDSGVLDLIFRANENPDAPYFLILDEMNLSHVERYFADFLSAMESGDEIPLCSVNTDIADVPQKIKIPRNFFIIGTVNIDETTNMFSPKVLDRANTIEFRITQNEMDMFLNNLTPLNMGLLRGVGANMAESFLEMSSSQLLLEQPNYQINNTLVQFFVELKKVGAEFGYRSATEIISLMNKLTSLDNELRLDQKLDIAIIQKLLPKLHGSRRKLCPVLETLGTFCITGDVNIIKDVYENIEFNFLDERVKLPLSLEKIARMYRGAIDNGFASFAEA